MSELAPNVTYFRHPAAPDLELIRVVEDSCLRETYADAYAFVALYAGAFDGWYRGSRHTWEPGNLKLKEPGNLYRDLHIHAPITVQVARFPAHVVERAAQALDLRGPVHFQAPRDGGAKAAQRVYAMHAVLADPSADSLVVETRVTEAVDAVLSSCAEGAPSAQHVRAPAAVHRARDFLRENLDQKVTLDALAAHAGMDKFHLTRAFRHSLGVPPYEYLTHLRIDRARQLLSAGMSAGDTAYAVGLYDQSQLNRHFRRLMGTTPAHYARCTSVKPMPRRASSGYRNRPPDASSR
ncbi:AraC family transcriptional regulator [Corallococcus sp. AB050B]|nr:AraC family transcriptional regulator [Corallococcus sp. AB050B]